MRNDEIYRYARIFRRAIVIAKEEGRFDDDKIFSEYPKHCCGETSLLLAKYLLSKDIETLYIWGEKFDGETHAWLMIKDEKVKGAQYIKKVPEEIKNYCNYYGGNIYDWESPKYDYNKDELLKGIIIDITADQFEKEPVYVGNVNNFYLEYEWRKPEEYICLPNQRLKRIYKRLEEYLMIY